MAEVNDQKIFIRHCLLYEFDQGHSAAEAARNIQATYGNDTMCMSTARRWFHRFQAGERRVVDAPRDGRPTRFNATILQADVKQNPSQTTRELGLKYSCSHATIDRHLHHLGMVNRDGQWVEVNSTKRIATSSKVTAKFDASPPPNKKVHATPMDNF